MKDSDLDLNGIKVYVDKHMDKNEILIGKPDQASKSVKGNFIITSPEIAEVLNELNRDIPKEKRDLLRKKLLKVKNTKI